VTKKRRIEITVERERICVLRRKEPTGVPLPKDSGDPAPAPNSRPDRTPGRKKPI
jgi:hypothetical protein